MRVWLQDFFALLTLWAGIYVAVLTWAAYFEVL